MPRHLFSVVVAVSGILVATACGSSGDSSSSGTMGTTSTGGVPGGTGGAAAGGATVGAGGTPVLGAGGTTSAGAAAGAGGGAAVCKNTGESCADSTDCCTGNICNNTAGSQELNGCHPPCTQNTDCATGCCVLFSGATRGICGDAKWCACGVAGAKCGSQLPACCSDQTCLAGDTAQTFYECKKRCTQNTDCPTSCCVPIPSLNLSACLDKSYCP